jgi:hypothetical protein
MAQSKTKISGKKSRVQLPEVISGRELYDSIMNRIEPELTSANYPKIRELTANETTEQRKKRAERYIKAFAEYDRRFNREELRWQDQFIRYRRASMAELEQESAGVDRSYITSLESAISSS